MVAAAASPAMLGEPAEAKRIVGTPGHDRITGTARADVIKALGGSDRIAGRGGSDRMSGGRGRDRLVGGPGKDRLFGGPGPDRLNAVDGRRDGTIRGGPGKDICMVDPADQAWVKGCETVRIVRPREPEDPEPSDGPGDPGQNCATPPADDAQAARDDDVPPTFSDAFYATEITLNASSDEPDGDALPISIEDVCDVPPPLLDEAAQLVGADGIAIVAPDTAIFDAQGQQLTGEAIAPALADADTVTVKARLQRPDAWRPDEDGEPVPTFAISRADITD